MRKTSLALTPKICPVTACDPSRARYTASGAILAVSIDLSFSTRAFWSGVSAGIDMGLTLVARMFGDDMAKVIQLAIEYDPQPPFDAGSPDNSTPEIVEMLRATMTQTVIGN